MTDELIVRARQNCCRLCLAPDSECVPIFTSLAADKEPLASKIYSCVSIKIGQTDRLSSRICHSCISYLNSWQSFKNRCIAAQMKQKNWLEMAKNTFRKQIDQIRGTRGEQQSSSYTNRTNASVSDHNDDSKDVIEEIILNDNEEGDEIMKLEVDPSQFLAQNEDDENIEKSQSKLIGNQGPQILTSLGLTHINSVNPFTFLSTELGNENGGGGLDDSGSTPTAGSSASCRVCKLSFSTRANARRHERNIHGKVLDTEVQAILNIKPRPTSITAMTPEMMGIYDYENPEKYRHLLTDQKIQFLRINEEFLQQYQNMTCKCCDKAYTTYKNFMAHMRKKYQNLSRNLCFKCLKQFQSKAFFVSHLKKKNCINLYKLYMNDDSISKTEPLTLSPDKMGTKDLLTNKIYECKLCKKTFRLKIEFRSHVYDDHAEYQRKDVPPGTCGFCQTEIEDSTIRRRHYNNMECIVVLSCGTCGEQIDNHQQFVDHVYSSHLPPHTINSAENPAASTENEKIIPDNRDQRPIDPRNPQNCKVCGHHYNSYYNVLRHMEAKHPDQLPNIYNCDRCNAGFPRQYALREHMNTVHNSGLSNRKREIFSCRMCSDTFYSRDRWLLHQSEQHSRYTCCYCNYQSKNLEEFKTHIEIHPQFSFTGRSARGSIRTPVTTELLSVTNGGNDGDDEGVDGSDDALLNPAKKQKLDENLKECHICHAVFNGNLGLSNHMRAHIANSRNGISRMVPAKNSRRGNLQIVKRERVGGGLAGDNRFRRMRCRICQRRFSTKRSYRSHMLLDHKIRNVQFIKCKVCHAEFTHQKGLKVHMFKVHGTLATANNTQLQFECDICSTVYRNEEQLNAHKSSVHGIGNEMDMKIPIAASSSSISQIVGEANYWFQCRYCPSNFDSNKKLAIHVNSHDEFDSNDYSCKDCGNVYSGRKSLWVHRYKKHPLIPDPSPCELCNKTFFDKNMLVLHLASHTQNDVLEKLDKLRTKIKNEQNYSAGDDSEKAETIELDSSTNLPDSIDQMMCTICNQEFIDANLYSKHMQLHDLDIYHDNPLAAMFDTGPEDPNQFYLSRMAENGEYICDICPKKFAQLTAFKVHRNWHFRSDSRQVAADPNIVWRGLTKRRKSVAAIKCQYCSSTFVNTSNLRRHIFELHKRETKRGSDSPQIFIDKHLECQKCDMKFKTNLEWVEHKINHARGAKSDSSYEWGCEICGKLVSRKERLVQHMSVHLKDDEIVNGVDQGNSQMGFDTNSQDSITSSNHRSNNATSTKSDDDSDKNDFSNGAGIVCGDNEDDDDDDVVDDGDHEIVENIVGQEIEDGVEIEDSDMELEENDYEPQHIQYEDSSSQPYHIEEPEKNLGPYSCDLCQVYFDTSKQLRRHVTSHFLNGPGSVTLTEIPKDKPIARIEIDDDVTTITPV